MSQENSNITLKYLIITEKKFNNLNKLIKLLESRNTFSVLKKDEETIRISLIDKKIVCDNVNVKLITLENSNPKSYFILVFNFDKLKDAEDFRRALATDISKMLDINIELLSDGISKEYSMKAYEILHDVENLIRSFITELMVFYGDPKWYEKDAKKILKLNENTGKYGIKILYERDFDQLREFLFTNYSDTSYEDLINNIIKEDDETKKTKLVTKLKDKIPKTFWEKLIAKHANKNSISGDQYKYLLEEIYKKRNKIAHCNTFHEDSFNKFKNDCEIIMEQTRLLISIIEEQKSKQNDNDDLRNVVSAIFSPFDSFDTIIVPAKEDGFQEVFLNQNKWYSVAIYEGRKDFIKYIAAYRVHPIQEITHYAEVDKIENSPYDNTKKIIYFKDNAIELPKTIKLGQDKHAFQRSRYTNFNKFDNAETTDDLL